MLPLYSTRSDIFQYQLTLLWYIDFVILEIITCDDIFQYLLIVKKYILIFLYWKMGLHIQMYIHFWSSLPGEHFKTIKKIFWNFFFNIYHLVYIIIIPTGIYWKLSSHVIFSIITKIFFKFLFYCFKMFSRLKRSKMYMDMHMYANAKLNF